MKNERTSTLDSSPTTDVGADGSPYREQLLFTLPRILGYFDANPLSRTLGYGDRRFWSWKLADFPNGTFQGAARGIAHMLDAGLLPLTVDENRVLQKIEDIFLATSKIKDRDGSLVEAFPYESSYCVTALVAFDLLATIELLGERLRPQQRELYLSVVAPLIGFIERHCERHAVITNHLATAAAALLRWSVLTGAPSAPAEKALERVLRAQSSEGWFIEYGGADPGYTTLTIDYLADIHVLRPQLGMQEPLHRAIQFLWHFAHPDGSFGGIYGSRNTRFYFPAGIEALASQFPEASALSAFMRNSIKTHRTVTLAGMDDLGIVPLFNSYASAAASCVANRVKAPCPVVPALERKKLSKDFPDAGLHIRADKNYYAIVATRKGGAVQWYSEPGFHEQLDLGVIAQDEHGNAYTTQHLQDSNSIDVGPSKIVVTAPFSRYLQLLPTPFKFLILRVLNMSVMRIPICRELVKKMLVRVLITNRAPMSVRNRRTIHFNDTIVIHDEWTEEPSPQLTRTKVGGAFSTIHMASQGYWQIQDVLSPSPRPESAREEDSSD